MLKKTFKSKCPVLYQVLKDLIDYDTFFYFLRSSKIMLYVLIVNVFCRRFLKQKTNFCCSFVFFLFRIDHINFSIFFLSSSLAHNLKEYK